MGIVELIKHLRQKEAELGELKEAIENLRQVIIEEMRLEGLKQVKTDDETVSVARRVTYQVREHDWRAWAFEQPDIEIDLFYVTTLDKKRVTDYAEKILKKTGEITPGIEASETEYLSVRKADK